MCGIQYWKGFAKDEFDMALPNGKVIKIKVQYVWKPLICSVFNAFSHLRNWRLTLPMKKETEILLSRNKAKQDVSSGYEKWSIKSKRKSTKSLAYSHGKMEKNKVKVVEEVINPNKIKALIEEMYLNDGKLIYAKVDKL